MKTERKKTINEWTKQWMNFFSLHFIKEQHSSQFGWTDLFVCYASSAILLFVYGVLIVVYVECISFHRWSYHPLGNFWTICWNATFKYTHSTAHERKFHLQLASFVCSRDASTFRTLTSLFNFYYMSRRRKQHFFLSKLTQTFWDVVDSSWMWFDKRIERKKKRKTIIHL